VLEIVPPESYASLDAAIRQLSQYDWLILTSTNSLEELARRCADAGVELSGSHLKVAAVGRATADAARQMGLGVELVPESFVAESLVAALVDGIRGKRVLLPRAAAARDVIPDALGVAGAQVDVVDAYRNVLPDAAVGLLQAAVGKGMDAATFTSSSSVTHLAEAAAKAGLAFPLLGVPAISIGPITSQTLRDHRWLPAAEASPHDIYGLVTAVAQYFAAR